MPILEVRNLSKSYKSTHALRDISFIVEQGEICGLLGPNGAGKTTLLRIVNSILSADSGSVFIDGRVASLSTSRSLGYMPEERGLYEKMRVEDQILYFGELKGGKRRRLREVMEEYLMLFNLSDDRHRQIRELSKGNQQKVQIISTIIHEPRIVILDEPFSGFDPINGQILKQLVERLHEQGTTVILSSHNMPAIEEMCRNILLIHKGKLLLDGRIDDIKETHKDSTLIVTMRTPLSDTFPEGIVEDIMSADSRDGRKGYGYKMKKCPGVSNNDVLIALSERSEIVRFEERLPLLTEIFLKYTRKD